jgi:hypothetical protein
VSGQPEAPAVPGVTRWRRKTVEVEAVQRTAENLEAIRKFAGTGRSMTEPDGTLRILVSSGWRRVNIGWWVGREARELFVDTGYGLVCDYERVPDPLVMPEDEFAAVRTIAERLGLGSDGPESSGVALIAAERARQVTAEGYTPEHDAHHGDGDLIRAAVAYATAAVGATEEHTAAWWPWDRPGFKPGDGPLRALVKAGALIAAEIDRLIDNG